MAVATTTFPSIPINEAFWIACSFFVFLIPAGLIFKKKVIPLVDATILKIKDVLNSSVRKREEEKGLLIKQRESLLAQIKKLDLIVSSAKKQKQNAIEKRTKELEQEYKVAIANVKDDIQFKKGQEDLRLRKVILNGAIDIVKNYLQKNKQDIKNLDISTQIKKFA